MKHIKYLPLLLVFFLLTGCFFVQDVKIGAVENIKIHEVSMKLIKMDVQIPVENPNPFKIKVKEMDMNLAVNSVDLGKVQSIEMIEIPAKSNDLISLPVNIQLKNILSGAIAIISAFTQSKASFHIQGTLKAGNFGLYKEIEINNENTVDLVK